jgi:pimeloyl-ACP methyl ester carboxylesterase
MRGPLVAFVAVVLGAPPLGRGASAAPPASSRAETSARHLIYLHGRIVQDTQSARPHSPRFGYYELDRIRDTFRSRGFVVTAEIRPRSASVSDSADHVVKEIRRLLASGVPPDHVIVVGASMGASIALLAWTRLRNPEVRFCTLGACVEKSVGALLRAGPKVPLGPLLSFREASDDFTEPCPSWGQDPELASRARVREIVLRTGLAHGFLYRPLKEWVDPVVEWATN